MACRWTLKNVETGEQFPLEKPTVLAGRSTRVEIICCSALISRQHARFLISKDGSLHVQDSNSSNGIYINGNRIDNETLYPLKAQDEVSLGIWTKLDYKARYDPPYYIFKVFKDTNTEGDFSEIITEPDVQNGSLALNVNKVEIKDVVSNGIEISSTEPQAVIKSEPTEHVPTFNGYSVEDDFIIIKDDEDDELMGSQLFGASEERKKESQIIQGIDILSVIKQETYVDISELRDSPFQVDSDTTEDEESTDEKVTIDLNTDLINFGPSPEDEPIEEKVTINLNTDLINFGPSSKDEPIEEKVTISLNTDLINFGPSTSASTTNLCVNQTDLRNTIPFETDEDLDDSLNDKVKSIKINYTKPPIIAPHVQKSKLKRPSTEKTAPATKKRRSTCPNDKLLALNKKTNLKRSISEGPEKKILVDIRKQKLKELANKNQESTKDDIKIKASMAKVKVSDNRGAFLLDALPTIKPKVVHKKPEIKSPPHKSVKEGPPPKVGSVPRLSHAIARPSFISNNYVNETVLQILHWKVLWLEQQKQFVEPPPINKHKAQRMLATFMSYNDYCNIVKPLLLLDLWYYIFDQVQSIAHAENRESSLAIITDENKTIISHHELKCVLYLKTSDVEKQNYVKEEDLVMIEVKIVADGNAFLKTMFGYVKGCSRSFITYKKDKNQFTNSSVEYEHQLEFRVCTQKFKGSVVRSRSMRLRIITTLVTHLRLFKAVTSLKSSRLYNKILYPKVEDYKIPPLEEARSYYNRDLNSIQMQTVREACHVCLNPNPQIYLIEGPPGTGKSTVIISIIKRLFLTKSSCRRILVTAPSNGAVDELACRLIKLRSQMKPEEKNLFKILRIGPKNIIHADVKAYSLTELAKKNLHRDIYNSTSFENREEIKRQQEKINHVQRNIVKHAPQQDGNQLQKRLAYLNSLLDGFYKNLLSSANYLEGLRKQEDTLLNGANIICSTLSSCNNSSMDRVFKSVNTRIECCIIDEATQSSEPETLIPLTLGVTKLILIGDPQQLRPSAISTYVKNLGYGKSLFSRIKKQFQFSKDNPIRMLRVQYRMHDEICSFPNRTYYGGRLTTAPLLEHLNPVSNLKPYLVFNLPTDTNPKVYSNESEIEFVFKLLEEISKSVGNRKCTVMIITPYNHQKFAFVKRLSENRFRTNLVINTSTVDSCQGQERDIVIMSCVRYSPNSFLSDSHRLNVAITRAKHILYMVGTSSLFLQCTELGKMREDAKRRNLLVNVTNVNFNLTPILAARPIGNNNILKCDTK